ncbi:hypothetical protein GCK72_017076 [Caenorhabditis remanei]|uniref:Uncharacterized protein n=1 Tax=Caenorhabditis remanei TaxID=31234 RepID=A0A6A5G6Q5_CAERE|nr:hypothetical protein GCK72_017076 [Caenorhabditis remanei]KAF1750526.1 hypothetical protein GCK72_017076 [Caenorhabditis remanei]
MIVTFSIRKQVEYLLTNGSFDDTLLRRSMASSMKKSSFEEYRPEIAMMSAIMLTTNKPNDSDFSSIFERLKNKIDDTTKNPIHVLIRNVNYKNVLNSSSVPKGRSSTSLIDPITLNSRTGREVQEMYNQALPTLLICCERADTWQAAVLFHWLLTRMTTIPSSILRYCYRVVLWLAIASPVFNTHHEPIYSFTNWVTIHYTDQYMR